MNLDELIEFLQSLKNEKEVDISNYKIKSHDIDYNTANGGSYIINKNINVYPATIKVDDIKQTITFGDYFEYYSY